MMKAFHAALSTNLHFHMVIIVFTILSGFKDCCFFSNYCCSYYQLLKNSHYQSLTHLNLSVQDTSVKCWIYQYLLHFQYKSFQNFPQLFALRFHSMQVQDIALLFSTIEDDAAL